MITCDPLKRSYPDTSIPGFNRFKLDSDTEELIQKKRTRILHLRQLRDKIMRQLDAYVAERQKDLSDPRFDPRKGDDWFFRYYQKVIAINSELKTLKETYPYCGL